MYMKPPRKAEVLNLCVKKRNAKWINANKIMVNPQKFIFFNNSFKLNQPVPSLQLLINNCPVTITEAVKY